MGHLDKTFTAVLQRSPNKGGWTYGETAFVHVIHAHAASAAGEVDKHRASYELAVAALRAISVEEERNYVASSFSHVPKP